MIDKSTSLTEAVSLVHSGQTFSLGGMTIYRRPVAFTLALIRQANPPRDLTLLAFTAGLASDMLVGAGMISRTRTCYFGLEIFGLAPMFTTAASNGQIEIVEESEASIAAGLRAQMAGLGFMPSQAWLGTDMFRSRPDVKIIVDPYTGKDVTAFPSISCDVAVIHVLKADRSGNAILGGNPTVDLELAAISGSVILTAEEVVDRLDKPIDIFNQLVTAVVHVPGGAWPTSCYPTYPIDGEEILRYIDACNQGLFDDYIRSIRTPTKWITP